jgi:WD40 repeat protein
LGRGFVPVAAAARRLRRTGERSESSPRHAYKAFISYSHAVDGRLAPAVQQSLHRFARPWYRLRAIRVFRDEASLSASPALWSSIAEALDGSEFFLLLASPEAAESGWVDQEVRRWFERREPSHLFVVLTGGDLEWDAGAGDFDWGRTTALPPVARGKFLEEPRWIDLRWARTADDVSLRNARFRGAIADLAAPLHGRPKDELVGEDVRQHRRTIRLAAAAAVGLAVLAALSSAGAVIAWHERGTAIERADVARSREFASEALRSLDTRLDRSLLLSLMAVRAAPTAEARNAVAMSLERSVGVEFLPGTPAEGVTSTAFSPDGRTLAVGGADGTLTLWNVVAHRQLGRARKGHGDSIEGIAFNPNGSMLATVAQNDAAVRLWEVPTLEKVGRPLHSGLTGLDTVALSSNLVAAGGGIEGNGEGPPPVGRIEVWHVDGGTRAGVLRDDEAGLGFSGISFAPNGRTLVSVDIGGAVRLWNMAALQPVGGPFHRRARAASFAPDGNSLAVGAFDGAVTLWSVARRDPIGAPLRRDGHAVTSLAFRSDGNTLASGSDAGTVKTWKLDARKPVGRPFTFQGGEIGSLAVRADGRLVGAGRLATRLALLKVGAALATPLVHRNGPGVNYTVSQDGKTLALRDADATVTVWDIATRRRLGTRMKVGRGDVWSMALSPDRQTIAIGGADGTVSLRGRDGRGTRLLGRHPDGVIGIGFSADGKTLASESGEGSLRLWDAAGGTSLGRLPGRVRATAFTPDGQTLAYSGDDGTTRLWDIAERRSRGMLFRGAVGGAEALAFNQAGNLLASSDSDGLSLFDVGSGESHRLLGQDGPVWSLAFSRDGKTLAVGGNDATRLWDVAGRKPLGQPLRNKGTDVNTLAFTSDDKRLVAAGSTLGGGANVLVWDGALWAHDADVLQARICGIVNRDFTRNEWADFRPGERYQAICRK